LNIRHRARKRNTAEGTRGGIGSPAVRSLRSRCFPSAVEWPAVPTREPEGPAVDGIQLRGPGGSRCGHRIPHHRDRREKGSPELAKPLDSVFWDVKVRPTPSSPSRVTPPPSNPIRVIDSAAFTPRAALHCTNRLPTEPAGGSGGIVAHCHLGGGPLPQGGGGRLRPLRRRPGGRACGPLRWPRRERGGCFHLDHSRGDTTVAAAVR